MITRIGFKQRFSPKHLLAPVVCLLAGLIFAREFEGLSGFKLAGVQLAACAMGCVMFMIPAMFNWVHVPLEKFKLFFSIIPVKPVHLQQFMSGMLFMGRALMLAAVEFFFLATIFPSIVPRTKETPGIFMFCLIPVFAISHFVVEWRSSSGFLKHIDMDPVTESDDSEEKTEVMEKKRSWFIRRWYVILIGVLVLGGGIMMIVTASLKSCDAYIEALARARDSQALVEAIGTPMDDGFMPTGSVKISGDFGEAQLSISVSGPKGSAVVYLEARKSMGKWSFSLLKAVVDGTGSEIDLLKKPASDQSPVWRRLRQRDLPEPTSVPYGLIQNPILN